MRYPMWHVSNWACVCVRGQRHDRPSIAAIHAPCLYSCHVWRLAPCQVTHTLFDIPLSIAYIYVSSKGDSQMTKPYGKMTLVELRAVCLAKGWMWAGSIKDKGTLISNLQRDAWP